MVRSLFFGSLAAFRLPLSNESQSRASLCSGPTILRIQRFAAGT